MTFSASAGIVVLALLGSFAAAHDSCGLACKGGTVATFKKSVLREAGWATPFSSNGCGASGMQVVVEPHLVGCCDLHDACYSICNVSRSYCDSEFQRCLQKRCTAGGRPDECRSSTSMLAMGAATFGCGAFRAAQAETCECGRPEEARSRLRALWREAYAGPLRGRHKDEADVVAARIADAADPPRRMYSALTKYPTELIQLLKKENPNTDL
jgi:hypothetical protein